MPRCSIGIVVTAEGAAQPDAGAAGTWASALTGRLTAEAVRALIGTVLITALGLALGLRFRHGWPAALVFILIPTIMVVGFTALVTALAIRDNARTGMTLLAERLRHAGVRRYQSNQPVPELVSAISSCATKTATHRSDAATGPRTAPGVAAGDDSHLGDRAARDLPSNRRAPLSARRRVERVS